MALTIYPRHTAECLNGPEGHPEKGLLRRYAKFAGKEFHRKLRAHKGCGCTLWFYGTWAGKTYPRQSLDVTIWTEAEKLIDIKKASTTGNAKVKLADAIRDWHREKTDEGLSSTTIDRHEEIGAALLKTAGQDALLQEVDASVIRSLRNAWAQRDLKPSTRRTYLEWLKSFFTFCINEPQEWISKSPLPKKLPPRSNPEDHEETMPLDPKGGKENYLKVIAALSGPRTWRMSTRGRPSPPLRAERLALLCQLMFESGMRISDAIMFQPAKITLQPSVGDYTFQPIKTRRKGIKCTTHIPLWLCQKLRELPPLSGNYPFFNGASLAIKAQSTRRNTIAKIMRDEIRKAGESVGIPNVRPHRFRDSFAVYHLINGTDIKLISKMLGHTTVAMTEKQYLPWVEGLVDHQREAYIRAKEREAARANVVPIRPAAANE